MSFNGATAFRRWKRPVPRCPFAARLLSICCPFNGATAFRRWKRPVAVRLPVCCPFVVWMPSLQWGHRLSAMETSSPALPVCCPFAVYLLPLQWGHRLSAMETSSPALPVCCLVAAPSMGSPPFGDGNRSLWARLRHGFMTGGRWFRHRWAGLA